MLKLPGILKSKRYSFYDFLLGLMKILHLFPCKLYPTYHHTFLKFRFSKIIYAKLFYCLLMYEVLTLAGRGVVVALCVYFWGCACVYLWLCADDLLVALMIIVNDVWHREKDVDIAFAQDAIDEYKVWH